MALRSLTRQLLIAGAGALHLDEASATRVDDTARRHHGHVVRVFYIHGTPRSHEAIFRRYVTHLAERFNLITFETLKRLFAGESLESAGRRPAALLTFDDGLANNYEVAAPILEDAGTRGVFFVIPK